VELLSDADLNYYFATEKDEAPENSYEFFADFLLANGVIVPPFEIGTRVYAVITNMPFVRADVYECEVVWYALGKDGIRPTVEIKSDNIINGANLGLYLEDLFASREEAEQALVTDNNVGSKKEEGVADVD
jgi:hypothetical protein